MEVQAGAKEEVVSRYIFSDLSEFAKFMVYDFNYKEVDMAAEVPLAGQKEVNIKIYIRV